MRKIIAYFTLYLLFENAFWIVLAPNLFIASRLIIDLLTVLIVALALTTPRIKINFIKADAAMLGIFLIFLINLISSGGDIVEHIAGAKNFFRFYLIFLIARSITWTPSDFEKISRIITKSSIVISLIAIAQYLVPEFSLLFSEMRGTTLSQGDLAYNFSNTKIGSATGTLNVPSELGYFLCLSILITLSQPIKSKPNTALIVSIFLIAIFCTLKRFPLIISLIGILIFIAKSTPKKNLIAYSIPIFIATPVIAIAIAGSITSLDSTLLTSKELREEGGVSMISFLSEVLKPEFWSHISEESRLWFLSANTAHFLTHMNLFGYGSDIQNAMHSIWKESPSDFPKYLHGKYAPAFKDVYLVAFWASYGLIGLSLYLYTLNKLRGYAILCKKISPPLSKSLSIWLILFVAASLAERLPELKIISFATFLLAGIAYSIAKNHHAQTNPAKNP